MILVMGTMDIKEGTLERTQHALEKVIDATRQEDGCISYSFSQDIQDPYRLHLAEAWRDMAAFKAHLALPHMANFRKKVGTLGLIKSEVRFYESDEGTKLG